jgi:hypothetical protein
LFYQRNIFVHLAFIEDEKATAEQNKEVETPNVEIETLNVAMH